ncbi:polysaccharide pyruvyl transferase family protein [Mariniplasma anaerobium]|uniref:Polysaccharide pyruvyl transferase domain-containing protein n=1 Tax=Mariniplasma anaerobium TaxID=2735436 RepID=A0A7U9XV51_9MOLU|nr:polysaccharide pyruvyl transferase family protein [Mariniplasma anaerobium]BCR36091.1 hypothetical protein MPAN_009840 [Mariniplasma anaerobium]
MNLNNNKKNQNILIFGGGFENKGAESMTLVSVHELMRLYPNNEIIVISNSDYPSEKVREEKFNFSIFPINPNEMLYFGMDIFKMSYLLFNILRYVIRRKGIFKFRNKNKFKSILKNTFFSIDISGYALSSQWDFFTNMAFINRIKIHRKSQIPYFIMPQSFGPFKYRKTERIILQPLINRYIKYPKIVYCRENQGFNLLSKISASNLMKSLDLVLLSKEIDENALFKHEIDYPVIITPKNSVAIIPNSKNNKFSKENMNMVYINIIEKLVELNKTVYLLSHSREDLKVCKEIFNNCKNHEKVIFIDKEFDNIELSFLIAKMNYIIGSRYHSIIHAYKLGIPAVVIGWAEKYRELTNAFNQNDFLVDVRDNFFDSKLAEIINTMEKNYNNESLKISSLLVNYQKFNPFISIEAKLNENT